MTHKLRDKMTHVVLSLGKEWGALDPSKLPGEALSSCALGEREMGGLDGRVTCNYRR